MKTTRCVSRLLILTLCLALGLPAPALLGSQVLAAEHGAASSSRSHHLRKEQTQDSPQARSGLEEALDQRPAAFLGEAPAATEQLFLAAMAAEAVVRFAWYADEAIGVATRIPERADWSDFLRQVRTAVQAMKPSGFGLQNAAEQFDAAGGSRWAEDDRWRWFERYFRYKVRELLQNIYGFGLTLLQGHEEDVPEAVNEGVRNGLTGSLLNFKVLISRLSLVPTEEGFGLDDLTDLHPRNTLTDEEWELLLRLQDEWWDRFGPLGTPLPQYRISATGTYVTSPRLASAQMLKRAEVGPESVVGDPCAGFGQPLDVAGVVRGARGVGRELNEERALAAQRWIEHLVDVGLLREGQITVELGDGLQMPLSVLTHLVVFPPTKSFRKKLDVRVASHASQGPSSLEWMMALNDESWRQYGDIQRFWPHIMDSGDWEVVTRFSSPGGLVFRKKSTAPVTAKEAGLEEVPQFQPGENILMRMLGENRPPFEVKVFGGADRFPLYIANQRGSWHRLMRPSYVSMGTRLLLEQADPPLALRDVLDAFNSGVLVPLGERPSDRSAITLLEDNSPERLGILFDTVHTPSAQRELILRFKGILDTAGVWSVTDALLGTIAYLSKPGKRNHPHGTLVHRINHVLTNPLRNPRVQETFPEIELVDQIDAEKGLELWFVKLGEVTDVVEVLVHLRRGQQVRFGINVARDGTAATQELKKAFGTSMAHFMFDPAHVVEVFEMGLLSDPKKRHALGIMLSEWADGYEEFHSYPEHQGLVRIWTAEHPASEGAGGPTISPAASRGVWRHAIWLPAYYAQFVQPGRVWLSRLFLNSGDLVGVPPENWASEETPPILKIWDRSSGPNQLYGAEFLVFNALLQLAQHRTEEGQFQYFFVDDPGFALDALEDGMRAHVARVAQLPDWRWSIKGADPDARVREVFQAAHRAFPTLLAQPELLPDWDIFTEEVRDQALEVLRRGQTELARRFSGLEEAATERQFLEAVKQEALGRLRSMFMPSLGESFKDASANSEWQPFVDKVRGIARALNQKDFILQPAAAKFDSEKGSEWSSDPRWQRFERAFRYGIREVLQELHGLALTLLQGHEAPVPPTHDASSLKRIAFLVVELEVVFRDLERLDALEAVDQARQAFQLDDEEWRKLLLLQDEWWQRYGPMGRPLAQYRVTQTGTYATSSLLTSAQLMKRAEIGPDSLVGDPAVGLGQPLDVAGVLFGASGIGYELDHDRAAAAQEWIDHLVNVGLLTEGQVVIKPRHGLTLPLGEITHLYAFAPNGAFREDLDYRIARENAPHLKWLMIRDDMSPETEGDYTQLWYEVLASYRWEALTVDLPEDTVIFRRIETGLEEVEQFDSLEAFLGANPDFLMSSSTIRTMFNIPQDAEIGVWTVPHVPASEFAEIGVLVQAVPAGASERALAEQVEWEIAIERRIEQDKGRELEDVAFEIKDYPADGQVKNELPAVVVQKRGVELPVKPNPSVPVLLVSSPAHLMPELVWALAMNPDLQEHQIGPILGAMIHEDQLVIFV